MRFVYGPQDMTDLTAAQKNCCLITNGLGGYMSVTAAFGVNRCDQGILIASESAPNKRNLLVHRLKEELIFSESGCAGTAAVSGQRIFLSGQEFAAAQADSRTCESKEAGNASSKDSAITGSAAVCCLPPEEGFRYLTSFVVDDGLPIWNYHYRGVTIRRRCIMAYEKNAVILRWEIQNQSGCPVTLSITPCLCCIPKGHVLQEAFPMTLDMAGSSSRMKGQKDNLKKDSANGLIDDSENSSVRIWYSASVTANSIPVYIGTNGSITGQPPSFERLFYSFDRRDGRTPSGVCGSCCSIGMTAGDGQTEILELFLSDREEFSDFAAGFHGVLPGNFLPGALFPQVLKDFRDRQQKLLNGAGLKDPAARQLVLSAADFISAKESTGGKTLLAGYPFFGDWGRDTMISLPGCTLTTGQYEAARSILSTFLTYEKDGLVPNLFPDGNEAPMYNSVDAPLLLINGVWLYCRESGDHDFLTAAWPVMKRIIKAYQTGTHYGIRMDEDGLITAGRDLYQLTWMDVCVDGYLPTPRHGKPVEINAYWYNALRIMEQFASDPQLPGGPDAEFAAACGRLADQVRKSFSEKFWLEKEGYLKDLISSAAVCDTQIRCNQIWAVTMPFSMLSPTQEARIVNTVQKHLFTPCGLRTLSPEDPAFHPCYGGSLWERDTAYHQGTVWPFPLGAFYLAYLKVHGNSSEAVSYVRGMLTSMESMLREGCIGQLPEIYDGLYPGDSRGCFAQAWSVGELLRVYRKLEEIDAEDF